MENTNNPLKKPLGKWWSERTKTQKIWVIAIVIAFGVGVAIMGNNSPSACDCANIIEESPMNAPLDPNGNMREDADKYVQKEKACIKKYVKLDATQKALLDASTDMTYFQGELDQAIENAKKECNKEDVSATDELKPKKNSSATVEIHKDSALKEKEQNKSNNDTYILLL